MKSEKTLVHEHKWIHVHMATYFRAICRAVSPSLLTTLGSVSFSFTRICTTSRYPFLMKSTKVNDGNYIVGDTESLGCEWWGGVRITF